MDTPVPKFGFAFSNTIDVMRPKSTAETMGAEQKMICDAAGSTFSTA